MKEFRVVFTGDDGKLSEEFIKSAFDLDHYKDGSLVFYEIDGVQRMFAPGVWKHVKRSK